MSDTPRTDSVERGFTSDLSQNPQHRLSNLARQLERELAAAKDLAESTGRRQTRVCMFCGMESAAGNTQTERRKP